MLQVRKYPACVCYKIKINFKAWEIYSHMWFILFFYKYRKGRSSCLTMSGFFFVPCGYEILLKPFNFCIIGN